MKTIQQNGNPMNYIPVGANRIRPNNIRHNNRFAPNEFAPIKFNTKIFPKIKTGRMRFATTTHIHTKFSIALLR